MHLFTCFTGKLCTPNQSWNQARHQMLPGRAYNRAFSSLFFSGPGITIRKINLYINLGHIIFAIDSFHLLKVNEILIKLVLFAQLVEPRCLPKTDVEFLDSVVKTGIFEFSLSL